MDGTLYGTTVLGGPYEEGAVFSITPTGKETVISGFSGGGDGANPVAGLVYFEHALYGVTRDGGGGGGTVFRIDP